MERSLHNMSVKEYKKYHESFMENNPGSTAFHTFLCIFFTVQCSILCSLNTKYNSAYQYVFEYTVIVLPLTLAHTILADYIYLLNILLFIILIKYIHSIYPKFKLRKSFYLENNLKTHKLHSITCLRGLTYLITAYCILAVDFNSFPRYLAKTESYGYSLMDTGVGLFVLMSGLVHKNLKHIKFISILKANFKFVFILCCLGVVRFVSIKQLDYQEHVTEYGVHWNFFFTLAICKIFSTIILLYTEHAMVASIIVLILHEYLLIMGLEDWVFSETPRTIFFDANREGLSSSLGYLALYLFAAYLKSVLINKSLSRMKIQVKLVVLSIFLCLAAFIANCYRPTSRTLANLGYCLYLESVLTTVMTVLYFFEVQFQDKSVYFSVPLILSAVNDNGLTYFLIANLCTGAINLSIRTLFYSSTVTFLILNLYMSLTTILVIYLKRKGIRI